MCMDDTDHWARLAEAIRERRTALGLSISAGAQAGGMNRETWTNAETAKRQLSEHRWAGMERALRWAPGSIAKILEGGDPDEQAQPDRGADGDLADEIERISELRGITPGDRMRMIRALVKVYREQTEALT
jgi:hypothetical protein